MTSNATDYNGQTSESNSAGALRWTFFPILILAALSLFGAVGDGEMYLAWFIAFAYGTIALVVSIGLFLISLIDKYDGRGIKARVSGRILLGVLLSLVVLTVSCGINISTVELNF
jgi:hypothetical protein